MRIHCQEITLARLFRLFHRQLSSKMGPLSRHLVKEKRDPLFCVLLVPTGSDSGQCSLNFFYDLHNFPKPLKQPV